MSEWKDSKKGGPNSKGPEVRRGEWEDSMKGNQEDGRKRKKMLLLRNSNLQYG